MLFKFAIDQSGLLDEYISSKIAGHELKGLKSYFATHINGLSYPLMALIDFKGYRLIATLLLPIKQLVLFPLFFFL